MDTSFSLLRRLHMEKSFKKTSFFNLYIFIRSEMEINGK